MFILFTALANLYFTASGAPIVKDCGLGKTVFTINSVSISPPNPNPNDQVTLHLDYTVPVGVTIHGGEAKYAVVYNFFPLSPTVEPLCSDIPCPLSSGTYKNSSVSTWPSGLSGSFSSTLTWVDENSQKLLCVSIAATV